jgi:aryl carrier-like protein
MPIGGVGELLIEGHITGKGYWKDVQRTQASFIVSPNFLQEKQSSLAPCYRTGDLVRLTPDGRTHFIQRKDDQVKIRGHRVDLGDVAAALHKSFPSAADSAALLVLDEMTNTQHLLAIVCSETHDGNDKYLKPLPAKIQRELQQTIPRYMIPSLVLEVNRMPLTVSGKLDTKYLTLQVRGLLKSLLLEKEVSTASWTPQEKLLYELWTQLGIPVLDTHQNLFSIGADSLKTIQLLHGLRENGMSLTAVEVFTNPTIHDMARKLAIMDREDDVPVPEPFSFFPRDGTVVSNIMNVVSDPSLIEDVIPCSPVQTGLMTASLQKDNVYINQMSYKPRTSIDVISLNRAWSLVVDELSILRTRIYNTDSGFVQVVMARQDKTCQVYEFPATYHSEIGRKRSPMKIGDQLFEVSIIAQGQNVVEMWITAHHAISDAWMMKQVLNKLFSKYSQQPGTSYLPFSSFIQKLEMRNQEPSKVFWTSRLEGATVPSYPEDRSPLHYRPCTTAVRSTPLSMTALNRSKFTMATLAEAAWAILLQKYSNSDDITFGLTVNGRVTDMSVANINGPTLATIPSRIQLPESNQKLDEFLYRIQNNTLDALPHAQFGVQNISQVSPDAANACSFRSLLVVQAEPEDSEQGLFKHIPGSTRVSMDYPLVIEVDLSADSYELRASFDETILTTTIVERILQQLKHILIQLQLAGPTSCLSDIDVVSPYDLGIIHKWNEDIALPAEACIHESYSQQALANANKQAIVSWDGQLTYQELEEKSSQLANVLMQIGIGKGSLVCLFTMFLTIAYS